MILPSLPDHPPLAALVRGEGPPDVLLLHGFGLQPRTYAWTVDVLAVEDRVIVPHWLDTEERWSYERSLAGIHATVRERDAAELTVIGHSFGGALALGFAAHFPDLVDTLVISDSLALGPRWELARNFVTGLPFIRLATYRAAVDFFSSWRRHSSDLVRAGWWAFNRSIADEVDAVAASDLRRFVLWAQRDTMLDRGAGRDFAAMIGAEFHTVVPPEGGGPVDHDWVYRHPLLFISMLERIGVPTPLTTEAVERPAGDGIVHGTPGA